MAVLMTIEVPGGTTAKYDRANEILGIAGEHDAPPGLVAHVCGVTDDGIVVVDVWESIAALDDFLRNRLGPALAQAEMPDAVPNTSPVHNLLFGAGKESNVLVLIDMAGFTAEAYDTIIAAMPAHIGNGDQHPAVMHVAALEPDGNIRVADLWDSEAAFGEFAATQIGPASGGSMPPIVPRIVPVYNRLHAPVRTTA